MHYLALKGKVAKRGRKSLIKKTYQYHLLILPGLLVLLIYNILPFIGNIMAFQNFQPIMGFLKSQWVGLDNFRYMLILPDTYRIF